VADIAGSYITSPNAVRQNTDFIDQIGSTASDGAARFEDKAAEESHPDVWGDDDFGKKLWSKAEKEYAMARSTSKSISDSITSMVEALHKNITSMQNNQQDQLDGIHDAANNGLGGGGITGGGVSGGSGKH
jgi:hypothetical protein